jgi:hypothetical protein
MKDLPLPVVALAKKKAVEATAAWNNTVTGILIAAKAIYEVNEKIGEKGSGSFSAWAVEELKRTKETASRLATIGKRYQLLHACNNLPPNWGTLYELAKAPDDVFRRAIRRVQPDMERNEVVCLIMEETTEQKSPKKAVKPKGKQAKGKALPAVSEPAAEPGPREAANTTIMAGSVWRTVKDFADRVNTALASGSLSPEAKKFIVHNYIGPSIELLKTMREVILETPLLPAGSPEAITTGDASAHTAKFSNNTFSGTWDWTCTCDASGSAASREAARVQFKEHRSSTIHS